MSNTENFDESVIGHDPVAWGVETRPVVCADPETQAYVDRKAAEYEEEALAVFSAELSSLLTAVNRGIPPSTVLHGAVVYGRSNVSSLAGYLGQPVAEIQPQIEALSFLGVFVPTPGAQDDIEYEFNPSAEAFKLSE